MYLFILSRIFKLRNYFVIRVLTLYASDRLAFPVKSHIVHILDFVSPTVSVTTVQTLLLLHESICR